VIGGGTNIIQIAENLLELFDNDLNMRYNRSMQPQSEGEKQAAAWLRDEYYDLETTTESEPMQEKHLSQIIRERLQAAGHRFHCNDNIADYIQEGEIEQLVDEVAERFQGVLSSLVIDTDHDHNTKETARRVAKMFVKETFGGRYRAAPKVTAFPNLGYKSLYTAGPISIRSTCAHHFQNIVGRCWVGIVPEGEVIGLSKFNRLVHHICERPQIQEEMTTQIADALREYAKTEHIAVVVKAEHHCMTQRGVREHESDMTTAIMLGAFRTDPALKKEFYDICLSMKGHG
jgi:GTP cyclohydrolase I